MPEQRRHIDISSVKAFYDNVATLWGDHMDRPKIREIRDREAEMMRSSLKIAPHDRILSLGIGTANDEKRMGIPDVLLREIVWIGLDISPDMLVQARQNMATIGLVQAVIPNWFIADEKKGLPITDGVMDKCMFHHVCCHLDSVYMMLREVKRVLKPGGIVTFCELTEPFSAKTLETRPPVFDRMYPRPRESAIRQEGSALENIRPAGEYIDMLTRLNFIITGFQPVTTDSIHLTAIRSNRANGR